VQCSGRCLCLLRSPHSRCSSGGVANLLVRPTNARKFAADSAAGPAVKVGERTTTGHGHFGEAVCGDSKKVKQK
jgi:hypothetical protein